MSDTLSTHAALTAIAEFASKNSTTTTNWLAIHGAMEDAYWAARPSQDRPAALAAAMKAGEAKLALLKS